MRTHRNTTPTDLLKELVTSLFVFKVVVKLVYSLEGKFHLAINYCTKTRIACNIS